MTDVEHKPGGASVAAPATGGPTAAAVAADTAPGRKRALFLAVAKRVPFTTAYVLITMALSIAFGTLWSNAEDKPWYPDISYGLPSFEAGRWWTLVTGNFFALYPVYYLFVAGAFALLTGFAEYKLGTRRTIVLTVAYQVVAVLVVALVFLIFRNTGWTWAADRAQETDVGFSAGMLAVLGVASAAVRPPWRLRLRLAIWIYVLFSFLFVGQMADAEHLVAVALSLPFSTRLAGPRGLRARALPTRHEVRLLAFAMSLVTTGMLIIGNLLPNRITPLGVDDGVDDTATWFVLGILLLTVLIANGLRRGYRWAWVTEIVLLALPLLLVVLVIAVWILSLIFPDADLDLDGIPEFVATSVITASFLVMLIVTRRSFRVPRRSRRRLATSSAHPETARELIKKWGGDTISWMTTWSENRHMITEDGESFIAFVRHANVAVALGDPVGPPGSKKATIDAFVTLCDRAGMVPYIFSCTAETTAVTDALGWQSAQVAEDNVIDLPALEFKGKKWQDIRTALNKAPKEGITFRMVNLSDEPWALVRQVENLSQEWLGDKKLPEMGFTLGGLTEALDPEVRVGLALDQEGIVQGVTSWMPVYGRDGEIAGWTLDLMRRADGGFRATMEFLIASSCLWFKDQGAKFVSLSGAPLARSEGEEGHPEKAVEKFLNTLGATLEPVYGFRSLHKFKAKFQPRLTPMYMVYRDEADLPRIGLAITRAYLPNAGIGEMLSVVRH
ncbi:DUF2156 domain-containing protein [Nakamurella flavida]|uniref:DUF2156 domain-containing protein n=1 Tax=Nakamurella flavida TaxID=363630 RepID=A0A939BZ28_9ACTN|nr:DUF2156 domain-containing protein [Nakamurella flavida]MBM9475288.1 DUF2156 domain-containing protein [Nakamurella flavida]MDP9776862.1 lysylphosphatidylglycerol synthetase-like protein (DUF2156 family) [Nakamurella flavida]